MNLLKPEFWRYDHPWGSCPATGLIAYNETLDKNIIWNTDGSVSLLVTKENKTGWFMKTPEWVRVELPCQYTGGRIISKDPLWYGTYTFKFRLPNYKGSWIAIWLYEIFTKQMGVPPEVDLIEHFRKDGFLTRLHVTSTYHDKPSNPTNYSDQTVKTRNYWYPVDWCDTEIRYIWQPDRIMVYVDGKNVLTVLKSQVKSFPDFPMSLQLNSGVGDWKIGTTRPFIIKTIEYLPF
jgi:beta-glucanase (GH16 family)